MKLFKNLKNYKKVADKKEKIRDRLMVEYFLIRLWYENKEQDCFSFEPVNIRTENSPFFVDGISYDMAPMSEQSLAVFVHTATNDRLLLRNASSHKFYPAPVFVTREMLRLVTCFSGQMEHNTAK